jgi:hypothetical protein
MRQWRFGRSPSAPSGMAGRPEDLCCPGGTLAGLHAFDHLAARRWTVRTLFTHGGLRVAFFCRAKSAPKPQGRQIIVVCGRLLTSFATINTIRNSQRSVNWPQVRPLQPT